jgi:hypothetical protein
MEEYCTVYELSERIKFSKQTLYNLIHRGVFILGKHYLKPSPKKILFKWSEIQVWMGETTDSNDDHAIDLDIPAAHICERSRGANSFGEPKSLISI